MSNTDVIDLSHWNSVSSFQAIADSGVVGVIQKCTEGTGYVDPTYAPRLTEALGAGLKWGAYHFLKHGSVQSQMDWFVENAGLPEGSRWVIDYEDAACVLDDLQQALESLKYLDPTAEICVYAGGLLKGQVGGMKIPWLEPYSLWLAQYTSGMPTWPTQIWPAYTLWQYTDQGTCHGVSGDCDLNEFNGSDENCIKWFGPKKKMPIPTPRPRPKEPVMVDITTPDGVPVIVSINGRTIGEMLRALRDHRMRAGED